VSAVFEYVFYKGKFYDHSKDAAKDQTVGIVATRSILEIDKK